jgi:hypothetical protein
MCINDFIMKLLDRAKMRKGEGDAALFGAGLPALNQTFAKIASSHGDEQTNE